MFGRVPPFTITDELYRHEYDPHKGIHFFAELDDEHEPVVWTRTYAKGRVCYCSAGHREDTMRHTALKGILQRGLAWVCAADK